MGIVLQAVWGCREFVVAVSAKRCGIVPIVANVNIGEGSTNKSVGLMSEDSLTTIVTTAPCEGTGDLFIEWRSIAPDALLGQMHSGRILPDTTPSIDDAVRGLVSEGGKGLKYVRAQWFFVIEWRCVALDAL